MHELLVLRGLSTGQVQNVRHVNVIFSWYGSTYGRLECDTVRHSVMLVLVELY